jgi:poly(3-hydroxybutyrate) depolymerase
MSIPTGGIRATDGESAAAIMANLQAQNTTAANTAAATTSSVRGRAVTSSTTGATSRIRAAAKTTPTASDHTARPLRVTTSQNGTITVSNQ